MLERVGNFVHKYLWEELLLLVAVIFLLVQRPSITLALVIAFLYLIVTLLLNETFLLKGLKKGFGDIKKEYLYSALVLIFAVILFIWNFNLETIVLLTLFIAFALYEWDSRIIATGALISLASCPVLLISKQDALAEQMAVYAYFFLVMTVVLQIIEYKRHPELFKDEDDKE